MTKEQISNSLTKRLLKAFLIVTGITVIIVGLQFGIPGIYYLTMDKIEANSDVRILLENEYCVFGYDVNDQSIINSQNADNLSLHDTVSNGQSGIFPKMHNSGKCDNILRFEKEYFYFRTDGLTLKAKYKVNGKYELEVTESSNQEILEIKKYSFAVNQNGLNILGDDIMIKARKINN